MRLTKVLRKLPPYKYSTGTVSPAWSSYFDPFEDGFFYAIFCTPRLRIESAICGAWLWNNHSLVHLSWHLPSLFRLGASDHHVRLSTRSLEQLKLMDHT